MPKLPTRLRRPATQPVPAPATSTTPLVEAVSDKPWAQFTPAKYTPQQWRSACLIDTGAGGEDSKDRYKLPVKEPSGAYNRNGIHAAAGAHGVAAVQGITADQRQAAARKLAGLYRSQLKEDPPPSLLSAAGQSEAATEAASETTSEAADGQLATVELVEADTTTMAPAEGGDTGPTGRRRFRMRLIEGDRWGSSGYYSRGLLERDGPKVFPAGTLMFLDHPGATESMDRPERSVRDLAARIVTTPTYETSGPGVDKPGLYSVIEVFPHQQPMVDALADTMGVSIRAAGTSKPGEAAGREGPIITSLVRGHSVDFVTKAGAGGRLTEVLESARAASETGSTVAALAEAGSIGAWIESRLHLALTEICDDMYGYGQLTREERIALSSGVGDALDKFCAAVMADAPQLYQRTKWGDQADMTPDPDNDSPVSGAPVSGGPTSGGPFGEAAGADGAALTTTPAGWQVGQPVTTSTTSTAGTTPPVPATPSTSEGTMSETTGGAPAGQAGAATTQTAPVNTGPASLPPEFVSRLEEADKDRDELRTQVQQLMAERDAAQLASRRAASINTLRESATRALAGSGLSAPSHPRVIAAIVAAAPLSESGELDAEAAKGVIEAAIADERTYAAQLFEAAGAGVPRGLAAASATEQTPVDPTKRLTEAFVRLGMDDKTAALAAKGR